MRGTAIIRCVVRKTAMRTLLVGTLALMAACNGGGGGNSPSPPPPSITIKTVGAFYAGNNFLSGPFAIAGQGAFQLLVNGSGFSSSSIVNWNGSALPTMFGDTADLAQRFRVR